MQKYGEEKVMSAELDNKPHKMRKIMLFLNPTANKRFAALVSWIKVS